MLILMKRRNLLVLLALDDLLRLVRTVDNLHIRVTSICNKRLNDAWKERTEGELALAFARFLGG